MKKLWDSLMSTKQNPLMRLPKTVRFQIMSILSLMWSAIFSTILGITLWYPELVLIHIILLLFGIFGTKITFKIFTKEHK